MITYNTNCFQPFPFQKTLLKNDEFFKIFEEETKGRATSSTNYNYFNSLAKPSNTDSNYDDDNVRDNKQRYNIGRYINPSKQGGCISSKAKGNRLTSKNKNFLKSLGFIVNI